MRTTRLTRAAAASVVGGVVAGAVLAASMPAAAALARAASAGPWTLRGSTLVASATGNQGVATIATVSGRTAMLTRGSGSVPSDLRAAGWSHIGDPGAWGSTVVDAYQGPAGTSSKLFTLTFADGHRVTLRHQLARGESYHNSFAAPAPGGRWFVAGEWGTMSRLLIFPLPQRHGTGVAHRHLPLAATIRLTRPVRDVQGCAFDTATTLLCSTNDPGTDLFAIPRQLLTIRLSHPLDGRPTAGTPALLGAVPGQTACPGIGEVEGLDVHGNRLVVAVNAPCAPVTQLFTFTRGGHRAGAEHPATSWTPNPMHTDAITASRPRPPATTVPRRSH